MNKQAPLIRMGLCALVFFSLLGLAYYFTGVDSGQHWFSIAPPLLAVTLGLATQRIILSLFLGALLGAFLSGLVDVSAGNVFTVGVLRTWDIFSGVVFDTWNLKVLAFILLIFMIVTTAIRAGGLKGLITWLQTYATSARSAQFITYCLGLLVFIDDYANALLVGSSMRTITDKYRISREKLAFIVDSTSAPVAGIAFISTWVGFEVGQLGKVAASNGLSVDGYMILFNILFFRFYCLMMLIFLVLNILSKRDFGPMRQAQNRAQTTGRVVAEDAKLPRLNKKIVIEHAAKAQCHAVTALLPIAGLLLYFIFGLWLAGGGWQTFLQDPMSLVRLDAWHRIIGSVDDNMMILDQAGIFGLVIVMVCALCIARLKMRDIWHAVGIALQTVIVPCVIIISAWALKSAGDMLGTDHYLASLIGHQIALNLLPISVFITAGIISFATGSSWGTMAILIPIAGSLAIQMEHGYGLITMLSLAAVLDGAIFGDHCSPLSDTTILSSMSTSCDHIHHVKTQLPYALLVAVSACLLGYLPASYGLHWQWSLLLAAIVFALVFFKITHTVGDYARRAKKNCQAASD